MISRAPAGKQPGSDHSVVLTCLEFWQSRMTLGMLKRRDMCTHALSSATSGLRPCEGRITKFCPAFFLLSI